MLLLSVLSLQLTAQENDTLPTTADSVLSYESYIALVMENHPVVFRADMTAEQGARGVQGAKGAFDPQLGGSVKQKYFKGSQYYDHMNGYLRVPTWFGLTAEAGYDQTGGVYLNPERTLPDNGLWYAGLRLELGNGLLIDQRRAELKKARLWEEASLLERRVMVNQIINEATIAYWKWAKAYEVLQVYQQAMDAARIRLDAVKSYVEFGDRPGIYITEASMQYQNRQISFQEALLEWQNASLKLELYLWSDGFVPLELNGAVPKILSESVQGMDILFDMDTVIANHPLAELNELEIAKARVDLRLKREYLKPKLTLEYNALNEPISNNFFSEYNVANYTWGAKLSYPIFTRRERADVRIGELKVASQELKGAEIGVKLEYQLGAARNTLQNLVGQYTIIGASVTAASELMEAEQALFNNGESSLFMINSRELKYLETRVKQIELASKVEISKSELSYGMLYVLP